MFILLTAFSLATSRTADAPPIYAILTISLPQALASGLPIGCGTAQVTRVQEVDMLRITSRPRRWPAAVLLAVAATAIGAVFGITDNSQAASTDQPASTAPPTISGTPQEGSTLTATDGTWSGTTPITYSDAWSRCDETGGSCAPINGATTSTYALKHVDTGNTLRVTVTAKNADGSNEATSVPTAVVTATPAPPTPAPTGCPSGTGSVQVADVSSPARLAIDQQTVNPGTVTLATTTIQTHFRVTACGGRPVQGALLYATAIPYNQFSVPAEATTGADGTVNVSMSRLRGFPAARQQQLLVVFARARKPGEPLTGGISTRLLVSFPVSLKP
jgi:hypothetical protein